MADTKWEKNLKHYNNLVDQCPRFQRKGKTMPYTSANGHMFSLLNKSGELGIRFSKQRQEELFNLLNSSYFKSYGATMKGYVLIPEHLFDDPNLLVTLLNESYDYVMSLPSK